ncbi:MAG: tetratricopeptide repeat protein [Pseudomonadota bacterium]
MRHFLFVAGVTATLWAGPVQAQAAGGSRAAAEALFNEGRALMAKGAFNQACPKFEASQQLDPGLGTQLNLAECYEKLGKTASAWAEYREAIPLARASGSKVREDLALERAQALEARLSTLTIRAMGGKDSAALEIRRDGVTVQPAELGSAIPVDPGQHTVEATAPGRKKWTSTVVVADASKLAVEVPALAPDAAAANRESAAVTGGPPGAASAPGDAAPSAQPGSGQRTAAVVVGATGVVGVGLGALFGLQARAAWSDAKTHCPSYQSCDRRGVDLHSTATSKATLSTVAFIAGGAALAVGAVLWFTADSGNKERVAVGFGPGTAFVRGSFQ